MILDPERRQLYTSALTPPPGYRFDQALGTTYSLDLTTLLTLPVHLALCGLASAQRLLEDPVAVLEAIHQTAGRFTVFCQRGRMQAPRVAHRLLSQLEPAVIEVAAPNGGSFHPKLWVLRFVSDDEDVMLRVLVLSRNLTSDRSWDLSLLLEGWPTGRNRASQRGLGELVAALPDWAVDDVDDAVRERAALLADEVRRTEFELPPGFESIEFHAVGLRPRRWLPEDCDRLIVLSPFCSADALQQLAGRSREPRVLISRHEELDRLPSGALAPFQEVYELADEASTEDGQDTDEEATERLHGLHAKAYLWKRGWHTHIAVGSANATNAALLSGHNIELVAELVGRYSAVGQVHEVLDPDGFRQLLREYVPPDQPVADDPNELALDHARDQLAAARLRLICRPDGDLYRLVIVPEEPVLLGGLDSLVAWPVTVPPENFATDARALTEGQGVTLRAVDLASVTRLIAFQLTRGGKSRWLALNLPAEGLPEERDGAVFLAILQDRSGFLRYLLRLLADLGADGLVFGEAGGSGAWLSSSGADDEPPLLEMMVRALSRDPDRLQALRNRIERIKAAPGGIDILPDGFLGLWQAFEEVLDEDPA